MESSEDAAEQVLAWLVALRGGAPFLSPVDTRLLLEWLDAGVSVGAIQLALEAAADHRRATRRRAPLSLRDARRHLKAAGAARGSVASGPAALVEALLASGDPEERRVGGEIAALALEGEAWAEEAVRLAAGALDRIRARPSSEALRGEAEAEVEDLRALLRPEDVEAAVEEGVRDRLRRRHPLLSASRIWEALG